MARPRSPRQVVVALSLYLVLAANWPLWGAVARIGGAPSLYLRAVLALALLVACGTVALLSLTAWICWTVGLVVESGVSGAAARRHRQRVGLAKTKLNET